MHRLKVMWWLAAGITGAIVFGLFQVLTGPATIPQFMGQQIVEQGGYPQALTIPVGWAVHIGVSLSYSLLFAVIMIFLSSQSPASRLVLGLVLAALLGWITTLLTVPAITVTITVLSGHGFPAQLPGLNTTFGLPLWNHLLFFGIVWAIYLLVPSLLKKI
jgi:hypothetical protein